MHQSNWIRDQNIKLFRAALSSALLPEKRATIEALLAKELAECEAAQHSIPAASAEEASATKP
jgi:hypothetical protein